MLFALLLVGALVDSSRHATLRPANARPALPHLASPKPLSQSGQSAPVPPDSLVAALLKARGLTAANWMNPARLIGDFDGDGKSDIALLVASTKSKKLGLVIVHGGRTTTAVIGAGVNFGNGGDDFEWANRWVVVKRKGKFDALLVERAESGGGLVAYAGGKYRWRQQGD